MVAFSWQQLHDKIPSRSNLGHIGIIHDNDAVSCVLCHRRVESASNLFLRCDFTIKV